MSTEATCTRCGKKLLITDGDGVHTCTPQKIKQDTPTEHLAEFADKFGFGEE